MDQTTMSTKGMILLLLSVLEFKLGVYTFPTHSLEMEKCGWDVKVMRDCPRLDSADVSWTCLANLKACDDGLEYHCARGYDKEEDKFVEACRKSKNCTIGREPRISFEQNNDVEIYCELCFNDDYYNSVPTKSSIEFSKCPHKKDNCSDKQIKIECKEANNQAASNRFCRCDARNGYIENEFSPPETGTYDPCTNKSIRCVKAATPCNPVNGKPHERMLNYTCKPVCADGYGRNETSDECRLLASPTKPNSTARTITITNSTTPKFNTTTQVTTATTKTTGTDYPEPSKDILVPKISPGVVLLVFVVVGCVIICLCMRRYIQNILRQSLSHVSGHGHSEIRNNRDPSGNTVETPLVESPGQTNGTAGTETDPSELTVETSLIESPRQTNETAGTDTGFGKRVLNKCYTYLIENLDIESILDQCQEKELLTAVQIKDIKSLKPSDRVRDTLDHISKGGIRKYEEFKKCLDVTEQYNLLKHLHDMEESQNKEDLATMCQSEPDVDNENGSEDNNGGSGGSNGCDDMGGDNDGSGGSNGYGDMGRDNDGSGGSNGYGDMGGDSDFGGAGSNSVFGDAGNDNGFGDNAGDNNFGSVDDKFVDVGDDDCFGYMRGEDSSRMAESNESIKQQEITENKVPDKVTPKHDELDEKFFNEKAALIDLENFSSNDIQSMSTSEKETLRKNAEAICLEMDTITKHAMELVSSHPVDYVCCRAEDLKQDAIQVQQMIKLHSGKRYTYPEQLQKVLSESVKTFQKQKQEQSKIKERLLQNCQEAGLHFHRETPANGNCFFEAISSQLERLGLQWQSAEELRRNVTQFLLENSQFDGPDQNSIIDIKDFLKDETLEDYIMKMAKNGEYADHVIVFVMSKYLQREIIIILSSPNTQRENCICIIGDGFKGDPLLLGHYWEYHYQSLEPKNC